MLEQVQHCARDFAAVAQLVERVHGKDEVTSSILVCGSSKHPSRVFFCFEFFFTDEQLERKRYTPVHLTVFFK